MRNIQLKLNALSLPLSQGSNVKARALFALQLDAS